MEVNEGTIRHHKILDFGSDTISGSAEIKHAISLDPILTTHGRLTIDAGTGNYRWSIGTNGF
jgi:hypothetical protein